MLSKQTRTRLKDFENSLTTYIPSNEYIVVEMKLKNPKEIFRNEDLFDQYEILREVGQKTAYNTKADFYFTTATKIYFIYNPAEHRPFKGCSTKLLTHITSDLSIEMLKELVIYGYDVENYFGFTGKIFNAFKRFSVAEFINQEFQYNYINSMTRFLSTRYDQKEYIGMTVTNMMKIYDKDLTELPENVKQGNRFVFDKLNHEFVELEDSIYDIFNKFAPVEQKESVTS